VEILRETLKEAILRVDRCNKY